MMDSRKILIFFIFCGTIILIFLLSTKNVHSNNNATQNILQNRKTKSPIETPHSTYSLHLKATKWPQLPRSSYSNSIYYSKEIKSNNIGNNGKRSEFAYSFYITREDYFCSALIISNNIRKWSKIDIVIHMVVAVDDASNKDLYNDVTMNKFMQLDNIYFRFVTNLLPSVDHKNSFWGQSWNKLWVFKLTDYKRVINLDADLYLKKNLDHLFQLPDVTLAMPRAYWLPQPRATTLLMVLKPSHQLFDEIISVGNMMNNNKNNNNNMVSNKNKNGGNWDMDILNSMFIDNMEFSMLPGIYGLLHDEFSTTLRQWLKKDIKETWEKTPLFHWSSWKPWSIEGNSSDVLNHGEYFKRSWTLWDEGKKNYCK